MTRQSIFKQTWPVFKKTIQVLFVFLFAISATFADMGHYLGTNIVPSIPKANAAGEGFALISPTSTVERGDTIEVTVQYNDIAGAYITGFNNYIYYASTVFDGISGVTDLVTGDWDVKGHLPYDPIGNVTYFTVSYSAFYNFPIFTSEGYGPVTDNFNAYKIYFKVRDDAPYGTTTIRAVDGGANTDTNPPPVNHNKSDYIDDYNGTGNINYSSFGSLEFTVTPVPPKLITLHSTSTDAVYMQGEAVSIVATYDLPLQSSSMVEVVLDTGDTVLLDNVGTGSASTTIAGYYVVGAGDSSADMTVLSLASSTVYSADGGLQNTTSMASTTSNIADTSDIMIDGVDLLVEYDTSATSSLESLGANLPTLKVAYNNVGSAITRASRTLDVVVTNGDAVAGSDYTLASSSPIAITIPAGDYSSIQTFSIPGDSINDDNVIEADETFIYSLNNLSTQLAKGDVDGQNSDEIDCNYTILNDDELTVQFVSSTASDYEDNGSNLPQVRVSGAEITLSESVAVEVTGGTATGAGDDYNFTSPATLTIPIADYTTPVDLAVPGLSINSDVDPEGNETIAFEINTPSNTYVNIGAQNTHTYTIVDDDLQAAVALKNNGAEPGTSAEFYVYFNQANAVANPVTITLEYVDGTATAGTDYDGTTLTVPIALGATTATLVVPVNDDQTVEPGGETFTVHLLSADNGIGISSTASTSQATITDNDAAGFTVTNNTSNLTEGGTADTSITVVLDNQPRTDVVIDLSSDDTGAVTVGPASMTFTSTTWSTPQTVTLTPVSDDDVADETPTVTISVNDASSDDGFDPLSDETISVTVSDDDSAGFTVSSGSLSLTEGDATNTSITVVLDAQPQSDVVFDLSSDDTSSLVVSPTTMTFTSTTWNITQNIGITAIQDLDVVHETPIVTVSVNDGSSDNDFDPLSDQTVNITLTDDDSPGFTISTTTSALTEGGAADTSATIVLTTQPSSDVVIDLSSDDTAAVTVGPASLTFTSSTWNIAQNLTITPIDDADVANESVTITASVNDASSDDDYDSLPDKTINATVADDDTSGYTVSAGTSALTEGGSADSSITVVLDAQPLTDVVIDVSSDDTGAATVSPAALTFTNSNWSTPQNITITPVNDADILDEALTVTTTINDASSDDDFDALADQTISVTVTDKDAVLTYDSSTFTESIANDGSVTTTISLTLAGDEFATLGAQTATEFTTSNVPAGLTAAITVTASTTATLSLTGSALAHSNADDVANMQISWKNAAFAGVQAANVTNGAKSDFVVDFENAVPYITYRGSFGEKTTNDGSLNGSIFALLAEDNFASSLTLGADVTVTNVPAGLTAVVTRESNSRARIRLTGNAASHTNANDVANLAITFADSAFQNHTAAEVINSSKNDGVIDFSDAPDNGISVTRMTMGREAGPQSVVFKVATTNAVSATTTFNYSTQDGSAEAGTDYTNTSGVGTIDPGSDSVEISVPVLDDSISEGIEKFTFGISGVSDPAITIGSAVVDGNIEDDEATPSDIDEDNVSSATESGSYNGGDTNNDGTIDAYQSHVAGTPNIGTASISSDYVAVEAIGNTCHLVSTLESNSETGFGVSDSSYDFPLGLVSYELICNDIGGSTLVRVYFETTLSSVSGLTFRKGSGSASQEVSGATLSLTTMGGKKVIVAEYTITDGGSLDSDGSANGYIVDPVGLAQVQQATTQQPSGGGGGGYGGNIAIPVYETIPGGTSISDIPLPEGIAIHDLIKAPNDGDPGTQYDTTVYYVGADNRRHVFPDSNVYFSWFCNFNNIKEVNLEDLAQIPLGKNVRYRPGAQMVTFYTTNKVYAVNKFGVLHWIPTEEIAQELYGANWNQKVKDIQDTFYTDYIFSADLTSKADFSSDTALTESLWPSSLYNIQNYQETAGPACYSQPLESQTVESNTSSNDEQTVPTSKYEFTLYLSQGSSGNEVLELQKLLKQLGFFPNDIDPNGYYGPTTEESVKAYQTDRGIAALGVVGPMTRASLNAE